MANDCSVACGVVEKFGGKRGEDAVILCMYFLHLRISGVVKVKAPLKGPATEIVRLHVNTYSRNRVLLAHNVAIIRVHVSQYGF